MARTMQGRRCAGVATGVAALLSVVCGAAPLRAQTPLLDARKDHVTSLTRELRHDQRLRVPEGSPFEVVRFPGPVGELSGLLGPAPDDWRRFPALVWVTGGWPPGGIDASAWTPQPVADDQSAQVFRQLGLVVFYPGFRGGFGNGGVQESFYGEVDDLLAAVSWLRTHPSVDPDRIWLAGHSTGGTLVLLAAEAGVDVRAVLSFAPVARPGGYGAGRLTYDPDDALEDGLRSPIGYLDGIRVPTFVITGTEDRNVVDLQAMDEGTDNPRVAFLPVSGADHFDLLAPIHLDVALQLTTTQGRGPLRLDAAMLTAACAEADVTQAVLRDLATREVLWRAGESSDRRRDVAHVFEADEARRLTALRAGVSDLGYDVGPPRAHDGRMRLVAVKRVDLGDGPALVERARTLTRLARERGLTYLGWTLVDDASR